MATDRRRSGRKGLAVFILIAATVSLAVFIWKGERASDGTSNLTTSAPTNSPVSIAPANSLTSTIVRRPIPPPEAINSNQLATTSLVDGQIALDRIGFSPGSIDGLNGLQTRAALRAFQSREGLPTTGTLDNETRARLTLGSGPLKNYRVEPADIARLLPLASTWLGKSEQPRLDYESLLELVAEKHHAHPNLVRRLNPTVDWNAVSAGTEITVPAVERETPRTKAAFIQIRLSDRTLQVFDSTNRLLAHFPCSIAQRVEKRPVGELTVAVLAPNPDYVFNPEIFPESAEARELKTKLKLQPGPNNPVGAAWIGLSLAGYGIHGTPKPEDVGRTESHGCFRLANWNAEYLLRLVTIGTPVRIEL